jgi:hypothetical protein
MQQNERSTKLIREVIIREQLTRMFPLIAKIDILFCASEMARQIDGFYYDKKFEGGKC